MNERMLELYRQAQVPDTAIDPSNNMPYETTRFSADKFAELIVRECMNICAEREEDIRNRIKDEGKAATAYMCRAYIKEHFGVEE
jgi:hypothetical protein